MWWMLAAMASPTRFLVPHAPAAEGAVVPLEGGVLVIGEGGTWFCADGGCARREPLPFPRHDFAVAIDAAGEVWVVGGWSEGEHGPVPYALVHRYNAVRDVWVGDEPMPSPWSHPHAAFAASGELQVTNATSEVVSADVAVRSSSGHWSVVPGTPVFQKVFGSESAQPLQIVAGHVWEPVTNEGAALVAPTGLPDCLQVDATRPRSPHPRLMENEHRLHALQGTVAISKPTADGRVELVVGDASDFCAPAAASTEP